MEFQSQAGRLWAEDSSGKLIAEITFPEEKPGVATLTTPLWTAPSGARG